MRYLVSLALLLICVVPASAGTATLTWTDTATNEAGFKVERTSAACTATGLVWAEIGQVGVNASQYIDSTPVDGNQYCYRIRAWNLKFSSDPTSIQYSGYSNLAGKDFPLAGPAVPGQLQVN